MDEKPTPRRGAARRRRPGARTALVAAVLALLVSAVPGSASAATPPKVTPLLDCWYPNDHDHGDDTFVFGYTSTYPTTRTFEPKSSSDHTSPASMADSLPTTFEPGEHHLVLTLRIPGNVFASTPTWTLDGTTLDIASAARLAGTCSSSELPAVANGAAFVLGLLLAGAAGFVVLRRVRSARASAGAGTGAA
jgi:hypothetical protein